MSVYFRVAAIKGLVLLILSVAPAAELRDISVASDTVIAIHIVDGRAIYPKVGERDVQPRIEGEPLDLARATNPATWILKSSNDPAYSAGLRPLKIGRKSKGRDYITQTMPVYKNTWAMEHFVYLILPKPLKTGASYEVSAEALGLGAKAVRFTFDPAKTVSEVIHVNQIGYVPSATKKYAYLSAWMGDLGGLNLDQEAVGGFKILDRATGKAAFSGMPKMRKVVSGEPDGGQPGELHHWRTDLWECDFSSFSTPGEYVLSVDRLGRSYPFKIGQDVYREPFVAVMRGLYHNRCGTDRKKPYSEYVRGLCHHPSIKPIYRSKIRRMDRQCDACQDVEATTEKVENGWGGYHDAGDWDREQGHPEIPMTLAFAFELAPEKFKDGELNIPESGNGLPDILDEALWGMDYYLRIQRPDGGVGYGLFLDSFPDSGEGPDTDTGNWYQYAEDPEASYKVAAAACQVSFALEKAGRKDLAPKYVESAKKAYAWALKNTREGDPAKVLRDLKNHAAIALYKATGEKTYHDAFVETLQVSSPTEALWWWGERDQRWGAWTYCLTERPGVDPSLKERLRLASLHHAEQNYVAMAEKRSSRSGYPWWNPLQWGRGSVPDTMALSAAWTLSGDQKFLGPQYTECDFKLGGNPLNMVWITGVGDKNPEQVFHPDSWYSSPDGLGRVVAGIVPEGPYKYDGPADGKGDTGPWSAKFVHASAYPDAKDWPPLELYFEARTCYPMNEFTVIQQALAAFSYGILCDVAP